MPSFTRESDGTLHVAVMGVNRIGKLQREAEASLAQGRTMVSALCSSTVLNTISGNLRSKSRVSGKTRYSNAQIPRRDLRRRETRYISEGVPVQDIRRIFFARVAATWSSTFSRSMISRLYAASTEDARAGFGGKASSDRNAMATAWNSSPLARCMVVTRTPGTARSSAFAFPSFKNGRLAA